MSRIYVTGHRNPDTDSIASAIGYAELKGRIDTRNEYVPVRLGEPNAQTRWLLDRSGATTPMLLEHVMLRVRDVMHEQFVVAGVQEPVRRVGLAMAREHLDLVPIVDDDGGLAGVMTERALARRYIRESREASSLVEAPTAVSAVVEVLEGELLVGDAEKLIAGRVWVYAMDIDSPSRIGEGDVVVVGDRRDAHRKLIERGASLLVISNSGTPDGETLEFAQERGVAIVRSTLDTYVTARMITLSAPCQALMDRDPLTVRPDDLVSDIADEIKNIHYRAAVAVDADRHPVGLLTRADLVAPKPRRVLLVDHAEQVQSVIGIEQAEIVEILDHHHIGSIETKVPVTATFDPVGSTATLVIERFRNNGLEPSPSTASMLLGAILSDTVILGSPTSTDRDTAAVEYLERVLAVDGRAFGREMFETTSDVTELSAEQIITRDAKEYEIAGKRTICVAQVETVGAALADRQGELAGALEQRRRRHGYHIYALMITDIFSQGTELLISGDRSLVERAFGVSVPDGSVDLPGVMSRKKQVVPRLLAAA
ncbi:MAG TPA: putative manganese-dependent inorganic diphosphatase [Solirubrobacteraceae bacterium]|jgi:manganese-dependent inorganic pyrophosphatase|nr:putative manganese-dependent inorganic diphosphatase [Solirubrobacteraceae bacterium]